MGILSIQSLQPAGLSGVEPWFGYILTNNTLAEVLETGYLTASAGLGYTFSDKESILVYTTDKKNQLLNVSIANGQISLTEMFTGSTPSTGNVALASVSITAAALASGGQVPIIAADSPTAQYVILNACSSTSGIEFETGDRDLIFTDGTNNYGRIPDFTLQTQPDSNAFGYATNTPGEIIFPDSGLFTPTQPGADVYAEYDSGSSDYATGQLDITFQYVKITE